MIPKVLKNFNLIVDGVGYAGIVEEINLPKLTLKTDEYRAGGMDVPVELEMGMNKLECDFTLAEYNPAVIKKFGLAMGSEAQVALTLKGGLDGEDGVDPVVVSLEGAWRELDFGNWKAGEKAPLKVSIALRKYTLSIKGTPLVNIDVVNMVREINGADQLSKMRAAIGV
ncbi:phage major tail tube protein [Zooshikella marina]|uniref:phage major tail tube protein n=1 Tax=Zooshikella ganghwensis TaxID=202772 RepID=UPI001BAF8305|nr:phage major tail tube protein [Zooshikella ganghwensis]MBU2707541.1 phage major tail tube protein [Zooshikella ganghwensis]